MRFIVAIILSGLLAFVLSLYFDWWAIAVATFVVAILIYQRPWVSFVSGFLSIFLMWGIIALWRDINNDGVLGKKIAALLPLGGSSVLLIIVGGLIGGLVGGMAALSASYLRTPVYKAG